MLALITLLACGGPSTPPVSTTAQAKAPDTQPVVTWNGGQLSLPEVEKTVQGRLDAMEQEYQLERYQLLTQALDGAVDDALLEAEAAAQGKPDVAALLKTEIEDKVTPPDDAALQAFYTQVQDQLRGAPFDAVKGMLAGELMKRQMGEAYGAYVADLRKRADVKGSVPYPDLKRVELALATTDPVLGNQEAPVTIVQFAEYQCYFCNKVSPTLDALVEDYDGKVKVVFKDFPLDNHPKAKPAAVAARCAGDQNAYWTMNKLLLGNQQALERSDFVEHAQGLSLDVAAFETCLDSGKHDDAIGAAFKLGQQAGVQATPTFYVNGLLISGAQPYDVFKDVIDQELAKL